MSDEYVYRTSVNDRTGVKVRAHQIEAHHIQGRCKGTDPAWLVELFQRPVNAEGSLGASNGTLRLINKVVAWGIHAGEWIILWPGGEVECRTDRHFSTTFDKLQAEPTPAAPATLPLPAPPAATTSTGLAASNLGRTWSPFNLIPDQLGAPFKAESRRDGEEPDTLERFTVWIGDDPRDDPHTHTWPFTSTILTGGYTERRYRKGPDGEWREIGVYVHRKGAVVEVPAGDAHVVYDVLPGTTTHMKIGKLTAGPRDWGHLVQADSSGELTYVPNESDPSFLGRLQALNIRPT